MGKTTAPLLSLDASGQFGRTLVFTKWKGIPTVRRYTVPANPNTPDQQAQRGKMANAVAAWKSILAADRAAWNRAASLSGSPLTGANLHTRASIAEQKREATAVLVYTLLVTPGDGQLVITAKAINQVTGAAVTELTDLYAQGGTRLTNLGAGVALVWNAGTSVYDATVTGLTNDVPAYVRCYRDDPANVVSGAYLATPTGA